MQKSQGSDSDLGLPVVNAEGGVSRLVGVMFIRAFIFSSNISPKPAKTLKQHGYHLLQTWRAFPQIESSKRWEKQFYWRKWFPIIKLICCIKFNWVFPEKNQKTESFIRSRAYICIRPVRSKRSPAHVIAFRNLTRALRGSVLRVKASFICMTINHYSIAKV